MSWGASERKSRYMLSSGWWVEGAWTELFCVRVSLTNICKTTLLRGSITCFNTGLLKETVDRDWLLTPSSPRARFRQLSTASVRNWLNWSGVTIAWKYSRNMLAMGHVWDNSLSMSRFASNFCLMVCRRVGTDAFVWLFRVTKDTTAWQILFKD